MYKIKGLPKTALIEMKWCNMRIKDQQVVEHGGMMSWIMGTIILDSWQKALTQMIQQGFKIGAVIDECISDLRKPERIKTILCWYYVEDMELEKLSSSTAGLSIGEEIIKKLETCKTWNQFYIEMRMDSVFQKKMKKKIEMERRLCGI